MATPRGSSDKSDIARCVLKLRSVVEHISGLNDPTRNEQLLRDVDIAVNALKDAVARQREGGGGRDSA